MTGFVVCLFCIILLESGRTGGHPDRSWDAQDTQDTYLHFPCQDDPHPQSLELESRTTGVILTALHQSWSVFAGENPKNRRIIFPWIDSLTDSLTY